MTPAPGARMVKTGYVFLILGGIAFVVSAILIPLGISRGSQAQGAIGDAPFVSERDPLVPLTADATHTVYTSIGPLPRGCVVQAPDGVEIPLEEVPPATIDTEGNQWTRSAEFTTRGAGEYALRCPENQPSVLGNTVWVKIVEGDDHASSILSGTLLMMSGVAVNLLGLLLASVGLVLWLVGRNRRRLQRPSAPPS